MMKSFIILVFLIFSVIAGAGEITFRDLYGFDLTNRMAKLVPEGKCIDVKSHLLKSLAFVNPKKMTPGEVWQDDSKTVAEASRFCANNKDVPLCDSLSEFIVLREIH